MKTKFFVLLLASLLIATLIGIIISGCGTSPTSSGSSSTPHGVIAYNGTQSPGDAWTWVIANSTWIGTNESLGFTIAGTYRTLISGFKKATVNYSTVTLEIPDDGSAQAYFLEFPNTALIVKPSGEADNVIFCAASASTFNPTLGDTFNYVTIPSNYFNTYESSAYGTAEVTKDTTPFEFTTNNYLLTGELSNTNVQGGYEFADGKLTHSSIDTEIYITPSGVFVGDNGTGEGGFAGCIAPEEIISTTEFASYNYLGVLFEYDASTGTGSTKPIGARAHDSISGGLYGFEIIDVESGAEDIAGGVTIEFTAQPSPGILEGIIEDPVDGPRPIIMVVNRINNKFIAIGIIDGGSSREVSNLIVIQK